MARQLDDVSSSPDSGHEPVLMRPISNWAIVVAALAVAGVTATLLIFLLSLASRPSSPAVPGAAPSVNPSIQIDAVRTALTAGAGTGGGFALLLAFRRQRHAEHATLESRYAAGADRRQREDAARDVAVDARERRVTELYANAAEQLGSIRAPVRLAGLYALERLGEAEESQRQTVVDLTCAYLRMPPSALSADGGGDGRQDYPEDELQVRMTAVAILLRCARSWGHLRVDLRGAALHSSDLSRGVLNGAEMEEADLSGCELHYANLSEAGLNGCNFTDALLGNARLEWSDLMGASFVKAWGVESKLMNSLLTGSDFSESNFIKADFSEADLTNCDFTGSTLFDANFVAADLTGVTFKDAKMAGAQFYDADIVDVDFKGVDVEGLKVIKAPEGYSTSR